MGYIQDAIDSVGAGGGEVVLSPGEYLESSTLILPPRSGECWIKGVGSRIKWNGATGGALFYMNRTVWNFVGLQLDGNGRVGGIGIHQENHGAGTYWAGASKVRDCSFTNWQVGFRNGRSGENQNGPSGTSFDGCKFYGNQIGISLESDQGVNLIFRDIVAQSNDAFIRTGGDQFSRGSFWLDGLTAGGNGIVFDLPGITSSTHISNVNAEQQNGSTFLRVNPSAEQGNTGIAYYLLDNCRVIQTGTGSYTALVFRQGLPLYCRGCVFNQGAIEIGNVVANATHIPQRVFDNCYADGVVSCDLDPTHPYRIIWTNEYARLGAPAKLLRVYDTGVLKREVNFEA